MSTIQATRLRKGMLVKHEGGLYRVLDLYHITPGNKRGHVQCKLRDIRSNPLIDYKFRSEDDVERATLDEHQMQFLYRDGDLLYFMNTETYDQIHVSGDIVGGAADYLLENQEAMVAQNNGAVLYIELPASVELVVSHTEPGLQGDRSTGGTKPATLETGAEIAVPLFLNTGDKIKVDTRDGRYLGRVNN